MSATNNNKPCEDKHYRKMRRTIKIVVYMALSALAILLLGLVFVWMYDKAPDNPFSHGWNLFFVIVFAILVACLQLPGYIMDIRKIEMGDPKSYAQEVKPKPYAAVLDHARKENLIDEDNKLNVPRTNFVRFCVKNGYFAPHRKENWKIIDGVLKDWQTEKPITAGQLTQSFQDLQARGQL